MKLCPQCAFVYEDHQRVCDMDGNVLVHDQAPVLPEPQVVPPTRLTINLPEESKSLPAVKSRSKRLPVLLILLVVLISLLSVFAIAQVRRSRSNHAVQSPQPRSAASENKTQPEPVDVASSTSVAVAATSEQLPDAAEEVATTIAADAPSLKPARLSSSPVAAGASTASSRSAIVRLRNGAAISVDEVWETKEGFWYRQAGMVTFLKRSQVSTIERSAPPRTSQKTAVDNGEQRVKKSEGRTAQNQLRLRRLEPVEKKPSRVRSFLKLTGRMLKKPFR